MSNIDDFLDNRARQADRICVGDTVRERTTGRRFKVLEVFSQDGPDGVMFFEFSCQALEPDKPGGMLPVIPFKPNMIERVRS